MTFERNKGHQEALDLSVHYRPIALKAILAACSIGSAKAKPTPLRREPNAIQISIGKRNTKPV